MCISPSEYLQRMETRWRSFGNTSNAPLRQSWEQLCQVLNEKVKSAKDRKELTSWKVLCPPTGSGKTQGLIVYASMLNSLPEEHPGMLIVTRRIEDADNIAQQINELSREYSKEQKDFAISYHSEKRGKIRMDELAEYPVLVICHKAYSLSLDRLNKKSQMEGTWDYFYSFFGGKRSLVTIDEAIDLIEYDEVDLQALRNVMHFGRGLKADFPREWTSLELLQGIFEKLSKYKDKHKEMILVDRPASEWIQQRESEEVSQLKKSGFFDDYEPPDFTDFKNALRSVRMDIILGKKDSREHQRLLNMCLETVSSVDSLFKTYFYYSRNQSAPTLNTSRLLVPTDSNNGGVILDATANCNVIYDLFEGVQIITPPDGTRNYSNVTLHVSYDHKVGKHDMKEEGKSLSLCQSLIGDLETRLSSGNRVLIVTHQAVEPFLIQCQPTTNIFSFETAHLGALDGSNEWKDCDSIVIFGLPYKPKRWSPSLFMGFQGVQSTEWFHNPELRKFKRYEDIRKAIDIGQMTSDIIQAINRVHCRKVIDDLGNCPETNIYILLPTRSEAQPLIDGITQEMPNIKLAEWNYSYQKQEKRGRKEGRGNFDESLVSYLKSLNNGDRIAASTIKKNLIIPASTWDRMVSRIKSGDELFSQLQEIGISYLPEKNRAYFIKALS